MAATQPERNTPMLLEAVPPLIELGEAGTQALLEKIEAVHAAVGLDGVNIPEIREESSKSDKGERVKPFAPRMEPRRLALRIHERLGLACMINRVVVHLERARQADWFRETWEEFGVRQFVLVGGEKSGIEYPGPGVPEANRIIREVIADPGLRVGSICIPTRAREASRMARKIAAGTDFFTTQIVYHPQEFTILLDALGRIEPAVPPTELYLTLCPVRGVRNIRFLHWLGVSLSGELEAWLTEQPERVMERSLEHIAGCWREIGHHRRDTASAFPVGVSLAPIGRIPDTVTVALARQLLRT